jgi:hypothetical protein
MKMVDFHESIHIHSIPPQKYAGPHTFGPNHVCRETCQPPSPSSPIIGVTLTAAAVMASSLGLTLLLRRIPVVS